MGQPSPSVVGSPAIIADSLLSTSEVWSQSPIRDIGGVDGESNKAAMYVAFTNTCIGYNMNYKGISQFVVFIYISQATIPSDFFLLFFFFDDSLNSSLFPHDENICSDSESLNA